MNTLFLKCTIARVPGTEIPLSHSGCELASSMKVRILKNLHTKMVQFECPRHRNPTLTLRLWEFHFPILSLPLSGVIRIGLQYESEIFWKFTQKNWLNRLQMVQFECPRHWNPTLTLRLWEFHFPIFSLPLSGVIRIGPQYESEKFEKITKQNWLNRLQMV